MHKQGFHLIKNFQLFSVEIIDECVSLSVLPTLVVWCFVIRVGRAWTGITVLSRVDVDFRLYEFMIANVKRESWRICIAYERVLLIPLWLVHELVSSFYCIHQEMSNNT